MITEAENPLKARLLAHLQFIYSDVDHADIAEQLLAAMRLSSSTPAPEQFRNNWDASDIWVISYADTIINGRQHPLHCLSAFLDQYLAEDINGVHVLPFFPFSSDDGFAVSDYSKVREDLGDWQDLEALACKRRLMSDLVINHCSSEHAWFQQYCNDESPGRDYFVDVEAGADLRAVVRPRTSPLLRPTETAQGIKNVWCTFSHDQIDLNFRNPAVLLEFVRILRLYLDHGVEIFRLDAIAFLWKEVGSASLNLPQTHEIVRLFRTLLEHANEQAILITETNIPNRENLSYFGNGNESHLVYNFSLPPLLLFTLWSGNCKHLKNWLMSMPPAQDGTSYLNFIASHDGIGLRPAEGLLDDAEIQQMVDTATAAGGQVSWRALDTQQQRPYELNIALFSALKRSFDGQDQWQLQRFICAHAIMLALEGIPAFYMHSLLATENDHARMAKTGHARSINRHQWGLTELTTLLDDEQSVQSIVLGRLRRLIQIRSQQAAFHPNAVQFTLHLGEKIFAFWRQSANRRQSIFVLNNISNETVSLPLSQLNLVLTDHWHDLISGQRFDDFHKDIEIQPYQSLWIANC